MTASIPDQIPAGIPHWFKDVPKSVDYYVVKVIAP